MGGAARAVSSVAKKVTSAVSNPVKTTIKLQQGMMDPGGLVKKTTGINMADPMNFFGGAGAGAALGGGVDSSGRPNDIFRESLRGQDGALKDQYKYDPTKSGAFGALKEQAMAAPGESPWAKMQLQKQGMEEMGAREGAGRAQSTALAEAQGQLMRTGGLGSGARTRMAMQSARDGARAQQDVARQGIASRLGIQEQDIGRQKELLGNVSGVELEGQNKNLGTLMGDVTNQGLFDLDKYKSQMAEWGAGKTANAQIAAANRPSKK
jgi:hypothetical protein